MTQSSLEEALRMLSAQIDQMANAADGQVPFNAAPLESAAAKLSEAVLHLPAAEARALLPTLEDVIAKLDGLSETMRVRGVQLPSDRPEEPAPKRAAKAINAYKTTGRY